MLRTAYLTWEFWIPSVLAVAAIGTIIWLFSHNQDLLRQKQLDHATHVQVQQVTTQIQALSGEVKDLSRKVQQNAKEVREVKTEIAK